LHAVEAATQQEHNAILIYGYPMYCRRFGFRHAKELEISNLDGKYPVAHMILELYEGALGCLRGMLHTGQITRPVGRQTGCQD